MTGQVPHHDPIAEAYVWVSRVATVVMLMVLPGVAGEWLDQRLGTEFLVLVGLGFGLVAGIVYLLKITSAPPSDDRPDNDQHPA